MSYSNFSFPDFVLDNFLINEGKEDFIGFVTPKSTLCWIDCSRFKYIQSHIFVANVFACCSQLPRNYVDTCV